MHVEINLGLPPIGCQHIAAETLGEERRNDGDTADQRDVVLQGDTVFA